MTVLFSNEPFYVLIYFKVIIINVNNYLLYPLHAGATENNLKDLNK